MTDTPQLTRITDGRTVPAVGSWQIDPAHTSVIMVGRHMMFTKVRGRIPELEGSFTVAERPENSHVEVALHSASITTQHEKRDSHLRSAEFLDAENYPTASFRSTRIEPNGEHWQMTGDLTIKGITHPVVLDLEFLGAGEDPYGRMKAAFTATGSINREDWDMKWNEVLETGGVLLGPEIGLEIEAQGVLDR